MKRTQQLSVTGRVALAGVLTLAFSAIAAPSLAASGKYGRKHARVGLACLSGTWRSRGIRTPAFSGGAGTRLRITIHGRGRGQYGVAEAEYDFGDPLYLTDAPGGYFKLSGESYGRFYYRGRGRFRFTNGIVAEDVTVFADGKVVVSTPVKGGAGYADISCTSSTLTTSVEVATEGGPARAVERWSRL